MSKHVELLKDKVCTSVVRTELPGEIVFTLDTGEKYKLYHDQDCCESVKLVDCCGDLEDLVGHPLHMSELVEKFNWDLGGYDDSETWSFYKFGTKEGYVTLRWQGRSNGYYSESVHFAKYDPEKENEWREGWINLY